MPGQRLLDTLRSSGSPRPHSIMRGISYQLSGLTPELAYRYSDDQLENAGHPRFVVPSPVTPSDGRCANTSCIDCWLVANKLPMPRTVKALARSVVRTQLDVDEELAAGRYAYLSASSMHDRGWSRVDNCEICFGSFTRQDDVHDDWKNLVRCPVYSAGNIRKSLCQVCLASACNNIWSNTFCWSPLEGAWRSQDAMFFFEPLDLDISYIWAQGNLFQSFGGGYYLTEEEANEVSRTERRAAEAHSRRGTVYSYHDTTPMQVHEPAGWPAVTPKDSLCFGVELEMENRTEDDSAGQEELANALGGMDGDEPKPNPGGGNYILMSDGSLSGSGVELITCPYTLDYHQKKFGWDAVLGTVKNIGKSGAGTTACGMHVHCNRKAISALTLGKMLVFVNGESNRALMARIAQRNSDRWARMYQKHIKQGMDEFSDKYEALHLTPNTIEFRIFRGNLRPARVLKNIEFCHSVVSYCKIASMKELNGHSGYLAWLGQNRGTYPNLIKFLGETYGFKDTAMHKQSAGLDI